MTETAAMNRNLKLNLTLRSIREQIAKRQICWEIGDYTVGWPTHNRPRAVMVDFLHFLSLFRRRTFLTVRRCAMFSRK